MKTHGLFLVVYLLAFKALPANADIIFEYRSQGFTEVLTGNSLTLGDTIIGTITFDSIGDKTPDVSLSVTSSGTPSLPFTISASNVAYGGTWVDSDGDTILDDPFSMGYQILLSENAAAGAFVEEILISDIGDQAAIDFDLGTFTTAHSASTQLSTGSFTSVPEPNVVAALSATLAAIYLRRRSRSLL